jgi:hypothetical protein
MSFSLASLTAYTEQQRLPLITKAVFSARTAALFTKQVGIKSAAALNLMDTDAAFQSGTACGWNVAGSASGTTTFTQRTITVAPLKIQEALCPRSLEQYWMQTQLTQGSTYDGVPFEQAYAEQKALRIAEALENAIWSGSTLVTGLLTILNAASGSTVSGNTAAISGSITTTNVISIFDNIYNRIPQAILTRNDLVIFCGWDVFRTLIGALKANTGVMYNQVDLQGLADGDIIYPGTNVRVVAVPGLLGYNRLVCSYLGNFFYGTDLMSDEERFELFWSRDNDEVRFQCALKIGVNVAYPDLVVDWRLA